MRKSALVLALAVMVAAPSAALAQKAAPKAAANPNAAGQKFVQNAFMQPYLAWQSVWAPKAAPVKAAAPAKKKAPAKKAAAPAKKKKK